MSKLSLRFLLIVLSFFGLSGLVFAGDDDWREVTLSERQMTKGAVEPDADAEAIFWETRIDDAGEDLVIKHYIRVKILTERGREKFSKVDIPYIKPDKIDNIAARIIKPDGTITVLQKTDVFDREIIKVNKEKVKSKSFAVAGIEPGVVFEYRYTERHRGSSASSRRIEFQKDIPVQLSLTYFRPFGNTRYLTFNAGDTKLVKDKGGYYVARMENISALHEEQFMPPVDEVKAWMLPYYVDDTSKPISDFWSYYGGSLARTYDTKGISKPGKDMKAAAAAIVGSSSDPIEKLKKIFEFCRTKIRNISFDQKLTEEELDKIKLNKDPEATYEKLQGRSGEINELFAALTAAAGFNTRLAFGGDRSKMFFNIRQAHQSFVHFSCVAVEVNGEWKFFDAGDPFIEFGMLPWKEEDTTALLLGAKDYLTRELPISPSSKSTKNRKGRFVLKEDGSLEGTVEISMSGQDSYAYKHALYDESASKQEEIIKDDIRQKISGAEIADLTLNNISNPLQNFSYSYKVKIPNYAQKTGKRLFFQPGFFEYGSNPAFATENRRYDIYFSYPWSESDDVEIVLPKAFTLDNAAAPQSVIEPSGRIGTDEIRIFFDSDKNTLTYRRNFQFGASSYTLFQKQNYKAIKNLFDEFHRADTHVLTLKQN